jgi:hypothetical protein
VAEEDEMAHQRRRVSRGGSYLSCTRLAAAARALCLAAVAAVFAVAAAAGGARAAESDVLKVCKDQIYALCAAASCFVFDDVAYCKCDVEFGDSISAAFKFDHQNVCTVNAEARKNGYMVSTFSMPASVIKPSGDMALYTCPAETSDGASAQCDGGFCFESTKGQTFPGFAGRLNEDEIICSCPITVADPSTAKVGYQITGPYPCQKSFLKNCSSATANTHTGSTIHVGAPTGSAKALSRILYGEGNVPPIHQCKF